MLNPVTGCVLGILRKVVQQLFAGLHWAPGEGLRGEPPQEIWPVDLVKSHVQKNGLLDFAGCCFISIKHALSWRWFLSGHRLSAVVGTHVAMTPVKWLGRDQVGSTQQNWIVCILFFLLYPISKWDTADLYSGTASPVGRYFFRWGAKLVDFWWIQLTSGW